MFTLNQLKEIYPLGDKLGTPAKYYDALLHNMDLNNIKTPERMACFFGTLGVESAELKYVREIWGPTSAQESYEPPHRKAIELGNTDVGDGFKYRGVGLIQTTGKKNLRLASIALGVDYVEHPEWGMRPNDAVMLATFFWTSNNCNTIADTLGILGVSRQVNLGDAHSSSTPNGMTQRRMYHDRALNVLLRPDFSNVISGAIHD